MEKIKYMLKEGALWATFLVATTAFCYGFAMIIGLILRSFLWGDMMKRRSVRPVKDKRIFSRTADGGKAINISRPLFRGGIRF